MFEGKEEKHNFYSSCHIEKALLGLRSPLNSHYEKKKEQQTSVNLASTRVSAEDFSRRLNWSSWKCDHEAVEFEHELGRRLGGARYISGMNEMFRLLLFLHVKFPLQAIIFIVVYSAVDIGDGGKRASSNPHDNSKFLWARNVRGGETELRLVWAGRRFGTIKLSRMIVNWDTSALSTDRSGAEFNEQN